MKTLLTALAAALALVLTPTEGEAQSAAAVAEGAKLYGQNCLRCHTARSPMERTDREWVTIVNHMRARANLTRSHARALTAFLQQTNAPEATPGGPRGVPTAEAVPAPEAPRAEDEIPIPAPPPSLPPPPPPSGSGAPPGGSR